MKLTQVLGQFNQIEKTKFTGTLDRICQDVIKTDKKLEQHISQLDGQLKSASSNEITQLFFAVKDHYEQHLRESISLGGTQLSLLIKILSRDGNSIARISWVEALYEKEQKRVSILSKELAKEIEDEPETENLTRSNRLSIYKDCFEIAYRNDERLNREAKVTDDEKMILNVLADRFNLTSEESTGLEHLIIPVPSSGIQEALATLREYGIIFINKRLNKIFVPDEVIDILNKIQGKDLSDKYFIRVLRSMSDSELSCILKAHNTPFRGVLRQEKIKFIIHAGISIYSVLSKDMHDQNATQNHRKDRLKVMIESLNLAVSKLGTTLEERISILINTLKLTENDEFDALSASGFKELFASLSETKPSAITRLQQVFEIEPSENLDAEVLRNLSISPMDILYAYTNDEIKNIRNELGLSKRQDPRRAILESFASATDKLLDNYELLARRDLKGLDSAGIQIKESELGSKFEEATRALLEQLGLGVDEDLRKQINTAKDKADIIISLSDSDVIIGEAKSFKNGDFAKYASTSRQVKAYAGKCEGNGKRVMQVLIVAPFFSDDFIQSAEMDTDINISLLEAGGLKKIVDSYKARRHPKFSAKLLTKGGLLKSDLIAKSI